MRALPDVFAPGKMVLTGAYAVLRGAPALVVAVSRGAFASSTATSDPGREVLAALGAGPSPKVDVSALFDGDRKLGLGASAAALVATLAVVARRQGRDLLSSEVRRDLFERARAAHALAQQGGSGIDVAASVYGGTLEYQLVEDEALVVPRTLPEGIAFRAYASSTFARTTDLRKRVDALRTNNPVQDAQIFAVLADASRLAVGTCRTNDPAGFLGAARAFGEGLAELGRAADAPIVSPAEVELARLAASTGGAFFPSGAGGGDISVRLFLRSEAPSENFDAAARRNGMVPLDLHEDPGGVRETEDTFPTDLLEERPTP